MEQERIFTKPYPVILLITGNGHPFCENLPENKLINVNIFATDRDGFQFPMYKGPCNINTIENFYKQENFYEHKVQQKITQDLIQEYEEQNPIIPDVPQTLSLDDPSKVWIDPSKSPYVYNQSNAPEPQELYEEYPPTDTSHIKIQQPNKYKTRTKNVYNYKEAVRYSQPEEFDHGKFRNYTDNQNSNYDENDFECEVFSSQIPGEIINENAEKDSELEKQVELQEDGALKQLMSSDIQSGSKKRKTILFVGRDSHNGKTVQKIDNTDTTLQCPVTEVDNEVVIENTDFNPKKKIYQCASCEQLFDKMSDYRDHMSTHNRITRSKTKPRPTSEVNFLCVECGKSLKTKEKFESHCRGHGDPEVECEICRKVFASKFTLRTHRKIHDRKYPCSSCTKSYSNEEALNVHMSRVHYKFSCNTCSFRTSNLSEWTEHEIVHDNLYMADTSETEFAESFLDDVMNERDLITTSPQNEWPFETDNLQENSVYLGASEEIYSEESQVLNQHLFSKENESYSALFGIEREDVNNKADSVLAKIMQDQILSPKSKRHRGCKKVCGICGKNFDRASDLKRHLIEHVVRKALDTNPVNKDGTLNILCVVCKKETFTRIDRYKAHLREHAQLTLYKCTFCNKSFSDSSNFSKHKKVHSDTILQCDLCQRKFNSKKMLTQHMDYHKQNSPLECEYCDKEFYFQSTLNKHIKSVHTKKSNSSFRCKFCNTYFHSLKDKWDHEWTVHSVRKMIVDCLVCGAKFRKYLELKRHCTSKHDMAIPRAKKLLKNK